MTLLQQFAQVITQNDSEIQARIRPFIAGILLDISGSWIAGRGTEEGADLQAEALGPLGSGLLDRVARAVATTRLTETDDIHLASCTTAGAVVVPTALLLAPALGASPARIARAIAAGYDAMIRFAQALDGPSILYRGLWPTYLAAPLGAAAVASVLLDLDSDATSDALAIALAQTSGAPGQGGVGKSPRWLLAGLAARNGCVAALAAHKGFGGDRALLDSDWLKRTHGIEFNPAPLQRSTSGGALAEISRKPVCAARQTIASIEAFSRLLQEGIDPHEIEKVSVFVPNVYRGMISQLPTSRMGRIASVAYQLSLVAYQPDDLLDIERPPLQDERLSSFMMRVEIKADDKLDALYPRAWPARVEILCRDGTARALQVETAHGDPGNPLGDAALLAKFLRLATPVIGAAPAAECAALCSKALEDIDSMARLCAMLDGGLTQ